MGPGGAASAGFGGPAPRLGAGPGPRSNLAALGVRAGGRGGPAVARSVQARSASVSYSRSGSSSYGPGGRRYGYAFDILAYNGDDLTRLPLHLRKTNLEQLLRGRSDGIFVAPFEQGKIGPDLFDAACRMGLEGLVSKHRKRAYRGGRCDR
jgi:hypothetical protein